MPPVIRFLPRRELELLEKKKEPEPFLRILGRISFATRNGPRQAMAMAVSKVSSGIYSSSSMPAGRSLPFQIACVVDDNFGLAGLFSDRGERRRDGLRRGQIQFHDHALAALIDDRFGQRRGVRLGSCRQHDKTTFTGKLLSDGPADAPPGD